MKNLNEYKQMVFRRSEQKQKRRKQLRARIIACCIPLAVCIIAFFAWNALPGSVSKDMAPERDSLTGMAVPGDGSTIKNEAHAYTVQVSRDSSETVTVSNQDHIYHLIDMIENCYAIEENAPEQDDIAFGSTLPPEYIVGSTQPNYAMGDFADHVNETYTIRFTDPSGGETVYCLTDDQLTNSLTGQTVTLDAQQLSTLLEALDGLISQK